MTRLVDTTTIPTLLRLCQAERLDPSGIFTHRKRPMNLAQIILSLYMKVTQYIGFPFSEITEAYHKFQSAKKEMALKVIVDY
jgi:alcohol dehydrogenase